MKTSNIIFWILVMVYGVYYLVSVLNNNSSAASTEGKKLTPSETVASGQPQGDNIVHVDPEYKYEYRKGTTGNYEYNYDIEGTDENGESASGNVSITGKSGSGTITDANGDEVDIDVEWVGEGQLEGTDENGVTYELNVSP